MNDLFLFTLISATFLLRINQNKERNNAYYEICLQIKLEIKFCKDFYQVTDNASERLGCIAKL